jgi:hypothetical protein
MKNIDSFKNIIESLKTIESVSYLFHQDAPTDIFGVLLKFSDTEVYFLANEDDDTIQLHLKCQDEKILLKQSEDIFCSVVGKAVRWLWVMTNNQGYQDGIQLEFANSIEEDPIIVQFMVIASRISIRVITEVA